MMHEGTVVTVGQRDFSVTEFMLQAAVEEAEQELIGQKGGTVKLLLILYCYKQKGTHGQNKIKSIYFMTFYFLLK